MQQLLGLCETHLAMPSSARPSCPGYTVPFTPAATLVPQGANAYPGDQLNRGIVLIAAEIAARPVPKKT
jgi:hypothetical protein